MGQLSGQLTGTHHRGRLAELRGADPGQRAPPGPGEPSTGLALFRYRTRCGTVFGHSGNFFGYTQFTVATRNGRRALTFSVNRQLSPDLTTPFAPQAFRALRKAYGAAVCTLLGR